MLETVRNAFKIKEIRKRLIFTLLMLIVVRIGSQLPIPGINGDFFTNWFSENSSGAFGFLMRLLAVLLRTCQFLH